MNAAEIIQQIKTLPPDEVTAVRAFLSEDGPGVDFQQVVETVMADYAPLMRRLAE